MRNATLLTSSLLGAAAIALTAMTGCDDEATSPTPNPVVLKNHSVTPALVKGLPAGVEVFSLIGSDDTLTQSPGFIFGGSADGAGLMKNSDGTYTMLVNHEDNFAVSRVTFDNTFKPIKGEYVITSDHGRYRLCSATLASQEEHGFGPLFITCGESGFDSEIHGFEPMGAKNSSRMLEALGHWSTENAVPLPKSAYSGKTVIVIGDDDSGPQGGQLALYVSNTVGDLDNGGLYVMARTNDNTREMDMVVGQSYDVEFRKIDNQKALAADQFNVKAAELKSVAFGRVEDIDYRKSGGAGGREVYFTVTGQDYSGANTDRSRTKFGRVYRLTFNENDLLKGKLEVILDGDDRTGPAGKFQNPDNIYVGNDYVYVQEDPNGYDVTHDSYIYQYNIATKAVNVVMELDHRRGDAKYNVGGESKFGSWEYGAMIDISNLVGTPNTFAIAVQPHTWRGDRYKGVDGGTKRPDENQASQMIIVRGLPR